MRKVLKSNFFTMCHPCFISFWDRIWHQYAY